MIKVRALALSAALLVAFAPAFASAALPQVAQHIALHDGGWDILTVEPTSKRVLISRSDGVDAVETTTGAVIPRLISGARFHGISIVPGTSLALATQAAGSAVIFNVRTGKVLGEVKTDPDADATIYEPSTRTVWVMNGDSGTITIVDPIALKAVGTIKLGSALEFAAIDGHGHLFVNLTEKSELAEIDIASRKLLKLLALDGCQHPTGLAYVKTGILISACANGVAKLIEAKSGAVVGDIPVGLRPDGAFTDDARQRAYVPSGGDGTLTVIDTSGPMPRKIASVVTAVGARTGTIDPSTGVIYLPAARFAPPTSDHTRPTLVPGSVELLVVR